MDVDKHRQNAWFSWLFVGVLAALCATLGALQYKQIGEVGRAEHERLRGGLQLSLQRLSQEFNSEVSAASAALLPGPFWDAEAETEQAYAIAARASAAPGPGGTPMNMPIEVRQVMSGPPEEFQ